jgi:3-phenylpropionate/trans-cinnamate dioxygenase ferredoxin subunit
MTTRSDIDDLDWIEVAKLPEVPDGGVRFVEFDGRRAVMVRAGERVFVVSALCPHMAGPLARGKLSHPLVASAPGDLRVDFERPCIRCPWHNWDFDLATGESVADPTQAVRTYPTRIRDGIVLVAHRPRTN